MWTGLRIHYPIVEVRRREKRGGGRRKSGEKWGGGGKIGERGNEENSLPKGGGGRQGVGDTSLQCKYSDPLNSPKLFFRFVLADFTLLTLNYKKMFTYFYNIPKQKSAYIVQGANKKCLQMHDYVPLFWKIFRRRTPRFPLFSLVFIV